jgi:hypothetical protein
LYNQQAKPETLSILSISKMFVHRDEGQLGYDRGGQNGKEGKSHHKKKVEPDKKD